VTPQASNQLAAFGDGGGPLIYNNQVQGLATFTGGADGNADGLGTYSQYTAIYPYLSQINQWVANWENPSFPCWTWSNVPQNVVVHPNPGQTTATLTLPDPTVTDLFHPPQDTTFNEVGWQLSIPNGGTWLWDTGLPTSWSFPVGITMLSYTGMDDLGHAGGTISYTVTVLSPGDANGDGKVDINDLTIVLANYNQTGMTWSQGDFLGDGTVDINDLTIVLANYNTTIGAAGIKTVPEPSCVVLLTISVFALFLFRLKRRA
jgi:hypothetical protein